jgi:SAM-dependent methyltransferase
MDAVSLYNDWFFEEEGAVAAESAAVVMSWLLEELGHGTSVIDVGCGTGEWLAVAKWDGSRVCGVDGNVPERLLRIDESELVRYDLDSYQVRCDDWDLAICLEVAEHLEPGAAKFLVAGLALAKTILFSAATPGQPGIGHINCQPHDYWHDLFAQHGKTPEFIGDKFTEPVADFYRRNMFLYR